MSGLRKLIYIPSSEVWGSVQVAAKREGRSVSNYLVNLHRNNRVDVPIEDIRAAVKAVKGRKKVAPVQNPAVWSGGYSKDRQVGKK